MSGAHRPAASGNIVGLPVVICTRKLSLEVQCGVQDLGTRQACTQGSGCCGINRMRIYKNRQVADEESKQDETS